MREKNETNEHIIKSKLQEKNDGFESYVIRFDMGKKFNFSMGKYLQFLVVEGLQVKDTHFENSDYPVMFRFKRE